MSKRPYEGNHTGQQHKRHQAFQPIQRPSAYMSASSPTTILPSPLPRLPVIRTESLRDAPFRHSSTTHTGRNISDASTQSYDQLEFLGDAYIELFASKLIFQNHSNLPAGQMSQLREQLVKNETLAQYSHAYGFDERVQISEVERVRMKEGAKDRGNKGFNKILGDVLEAYVAAVVLDDAKNGEKTAERWMCELWQPKIAAAVKASHSNVRQMSGAAADLAAHGDLRTTYDDTAKARLQKKMAGRDTRLEYEAYKASVELKGDQIGQNRHFIALYFTGFGHKRELLGKGEGKNKVEAGNWAALEAMHGEKKALVEDVAAKLEVMREEKRLRMEKESREEAGAKQSSS